MSEDKDTSLGELTGQSLYERKREAEASGTTSVFWICWLAGEVGVGHTN